MKSPREFTIPIIDVLTLSNSAPHQKMWVREHGFNPARAPEPIRIPLRIPIPNETIGIGRRISIGISSGAGAGVMSESVTIHGGK